MTECWPFRKTQPKQIRGASAKFILIPSRWWRRCVLAVFTRPRDCDPINSNGLSSTYWRDSLPTTNECSPAQNANESVWRVAESFCQSTSGERPFQKTHCDALRYLCTTNCF